MAKLLRKVHPERRVYCLDLVEPSDGRNITFIHCDVRKPIVLPDDVKPTEEDVIFNFAAIHRTPGHPDHDYFETNIRGAENVTAFAEEWGIKKIVFTSSIAPYGASEEEKFEDTLPTPNTAYGISKLVAEKIHQLWAERGTRIQRINTDEETLHSERRLLIVRPGVVFGKGENGNFTRLYWSIRGGKFAYPGRKDTIKACIYVKELVRFMLYKISEERGVSSNYIYNCCYEPAYTIEHICEAMKKVTGLKRHILDIPNWLIMPAAAVIGALGAPMGICPARVKKLQVSTNICGKKMAESGYKFKWTFEEALNDWFEDNDRKGLR